MRRGGKTSFLHQLRADRIAGGRPRESQLLLGLEDERLIGMNALDLGWAIEEHARQFPSLRESGPLSLYLDEIQTISGWESLLHRLVETKNVEVIVSGSSAKLLSQEIATAARGRLLDVLMHPFSFREALRHAQAEPTAAWHALDSTERVFLEARLRAYLATGGFPEAQGTDVRDRARLLTGYVDTMVLRDVIERHRVTNPIALRALQRHLLAAPGGSFTVHKFYNFLKSQGVPIAKDTLHAYLDNLRDAFLVRVIDMHSASEKQRMVNPRKAYPIDPGLIPLYEHPGRANRGRALETAVLLELERREYAVTWLRVDDDREVDFFARRPGEPPLLVQVCMDTADDGTWEREVRALEMASAMYPDAEALLVTQDQSPPTRSLPGALRWYSATQWLLD
ncbi:MAG: ATP-binding protein [Gemmatimonadaceae bacterium]|nr:ATP-binding protein [Gemmatimonadaceae bacterium]